MMHIQRWLVIAMVFVLSGTLAFASGATEQDQSAEEQERVTITWMKWGSPTGVEARRDLLFEAFPEIGEQYALEPLIGGKKPSDVAQKLRLSMSANSDIGDMVMITYPMLKEFATTGVLEDVSDVYAPVIDDVIPAALDAVTIDGRQWGFVNQIKPRIWFYRKDMFDQAGINVDTIQTTDDFIEAGRQLQAEFPDSYIWNLGPNFGSSAHYNLGMILSGNGARYWDPEREEYVVDTDPGIRAAFRDMRRIYRSGITAPIDDWTPDWEQGFANGTIASTMIAIWFRDPEYLGDWAPDQSGEWAATTWPAIGGADGGSNEGAGLVVIPKSAQNKEGAKRISELLYLDTGGAIAHYEAVPTSFPTLHSAMDDPRVQEPDPYFGQSLLTAIDNALDQFELFPTTPATDKENQIMNQHFQRYVLGDEPLDKVLAEAQRELETQIGDPYELY